MTEANAARILIVEDEAVVQDIYHRLFRSSGHVLTFSDRGDEGLLLFERNPNFDLVVTDLMLPGLPGMEVLRRIRQISQDTPVVVATAYGSIDSAVEAMKAGANDYITKPFNNEAVLLVVQKALDRGRLVQENQQLKRALDHKFGFESIIGHSKPMTEIFELVQRSAPSNASILVRGESGTGKELIARAIHQNSARKNRAFVPIHAGAIPDTLLESHLFGHVRGAFTGAISDKKGMFLLADGGTLFLDEIGNLSLELQSKLLRVLQERELMPVGSTRNVKVDVRLICATNADLEQMMRTGSFREDLYYRLNVIEVCLPPLRRRTGDLPLLLDYFLRKFEQANQRCVSVVSPDVLSTLERYPWPGNVRELENLVERLVILAKDGQITAQLLPANFASTSGVEANASKPVDLTVPLAKQIQELERRLVQYALETTGGVQKQAAELLGMKNTTLSEMMKRLGLR
jgi:two-component system response regulator PilR (NtrC family)